MCSKTSRVLLALAVTLGVLGGSTSLAVAQQEPVSPADSAKKGQSANDATSDATSDANGDESVDERYKTLTTEAAKAYADEDYERALTLFQEAYALKAVPNLRYNMGRIEEKRGNFKESIAHYEKFVGLPGVDIKARKDALDRLKTLREVVALRQEGEDVDESKIEEKHEDRDLASAKGVQDEQTRAPARVERDYTAAYITLGLAVASYATSGYFALQARQANSDFEDATTRAARRDAASSGETSSIVADSTLGLGVVMTGLSVYFFLSPSETEVPADQTAMHLAPQIGPEGAGMSFLLEF